MLLSGLRLLGESDVVVRVDPAPGLVALRDDPVLKRCNIILDIGDAKNIDQQKSHC